MRNRLSSKIPDWEQMSSEGWNGWQRIAAMTNGFVSPANVFSLSGAAVAAWGLIYIIHGEFMTGFVMLGFGRLVDAFDGSVAKMTGTRSPVGAGVDAGLDKLLALLALVTFSVTGLIPGWLAVAIGLQSASNIVLSWYAFAHDGLLRPSREGKWSTAAYWMGLVLFVGGAFLPYATTAVQIGAYAAATAGLLLGTKASYGYYKAARTAGRDLRLAPGRFDRYIVIHNPLSSEAHRIQERIAVLRRLQPEGDFIIVQTVPGGGESNAEVLRDHAALLGPRTLLCIAAGDGTVSMVLNLLLHDKSLPRTARQTPILPLWCGNANDLAYMLNGRYSRRHLRRILHRGHVFAIKSLDCSLRLEDGSRRSYTAASYASFGATAYATQELERAMPRGSPTRRFTASRFGQELLAASWALAKAPTFTIIEGRRSRVIYERTYLNGSRFAKIFDIPLRLTDEKFHKNTVERKHLVVLLLSIIGLMNRQEVSKRAITRDEFTLPESVWAQFDGEAVYLPPGTRVAVSISKRPFYALSLRLKR